MAIYHQSVKAVSRSAGRSSTAAAAYRAGEKIIDLRTGEIFDYTKKQGIYHAEIIMPSGMEWKPTRSELWNAAELAEKRKDACVAREHEVALPKELNTEQRLELARTFAKDLADRHGCAVDVAIHAPHKEKDGKDNGNYHAHILCTTRKVEAEGLGGKCLREQAGQKRGADLERERSTWAKHVNHSLAQAGRVERVDHRTLEEQGIDREPTAHKGVAVTGMERRGIETDVGARLAAAKRQGEFERMLLAGLETQITRTELSLTAALQERAENERAGFERIGDALTAAGRDQRSSAAIITTASLDTKQLERDSWAIGKAGQRFQRSRRAEENYRSAGLELARLVPAVETVPQIVASLLTSVAAEREAARQRLEETKKRVASQPNPFAEMEERNRMHDERVAAILAKYQAAKQQSPAPVKAMDVQAALFKPTPQKDPLIARLDAAIASSDSKAIAACQFWIGNAIKAAKEALPPDFDIEKRREELRAEAISRMKKQLNEQAMRDRKSPAPFDSQGNITWSHVALEVAAEAKAYAGSQRPADGLFGRDKGGEAWDSKKEHLSKVAMKWKYRVEGMERTLREQSGKHIVAADNLLAKEADAARAAAPERAQIVERCNALEKERERAKAALKGLLPPEKKQDLGWSR